jgi:hypothetical protein
VDQFSGAYWLIPVIRAAGIAEVVLYFARPTWLARLAFWPARAG